jgi:type II secretory pathway predicted ATPase ExeA
MSRVAQFGVLSPLTKEDAIAMMEHRWKTAGGKLPLPFVSEALKHIYQAAKGLPRDIIKVSNSALTHAYATRQRDVSLKSAQFAVDEHHLGNVDQEENVK